MIRLPVTIQEIIAICDFVIQKPEASTPSKIRELCQTLRDSIADAIEHGENTVEAFHRDKGAMKRSGYNYDVQGARSVKRPRLKLAQEGEDSKISIKLDDSPSVIRDSSLSPTQHPFCTPEVLGSIFEFSSYKDNVSNACVCRTWSNKAFDVIWREVKNLAHALRLLAPLKGGGSEPYGFVQPIKLQDWARFDEYSWRVKVLVVPKEERYDLSVLHEIARTRPRLDIFPNLVTLHYEDNLSMVPLFVHPGVLNLSFDITNKSDEDGEDIGTILPYIAARAPKLEWLTISAWFARSPESLEPLAEMLVKLYSLKGLTLPRQWLTPAITHAVAPLRALEELDSVSQGEEPFMRTDNFSTTLPNKSFAVLRRLAVVIPFPHANLCFSQEFRPRSLTTINLKSPHSEPSTHLATIIKTIASNYPRLKSLTLLSAKPSQPVLDESLTFAALEPLLSCTELKRLIFRHNAPFELDSQNLVSIFKALPFLQTFSLRHFSSPSRPPTALSAIIPFCQNLQYLRLYIGPASSLSIVEDNIIPFSSFPALTCLHVGYSPAADLKSTSIFLSRILPYGCQIEYYTGSNWNVIADLVSLLMQVRAEERRKNSLLR